MYQRIPTPAELNEILITPVAAGDAIGLVSREIAKLIELGFTPVRVAGRVLFYRHEVGAFLERRKLQVAAPGSRAPAPKYRDQVPSLVPPTPGVDVLAQGDA